MVDPRAPWSGVTFTGAYWNCADRLEKLLTTVRPWFKNIVVVVQESPDNTLEVARELANVAIPDVWHGRGDPSITLAVASVKTPWAFVISDDEMPSEALLNSFQGLADRLITEQMDGAWFHFVSSIDGFDFTREQDEHLRFFRSSIPWPSSPHARPMTQRTIRWREGHVSHDRSLDEMMTDYLRKYDICAKHPEWSQQQAHNVRMMQGACNAIGERKGWDYVHSFEWWPRMLEVSYGGVDPAPAAKPATSDNEEPPQEEAPVKKKRSAK